jgi:hypothetical protein
MNLRLLKGVAILALALTSCKPSYKLPDAKMRPVQICGYDFCMPGNPPGTIFHFYKKPFSPQIKENSSQQEIAYSVIGQVFKSGDMYGSIPLDCAPSGQKQPFQKSDIVPLISLTGRLFDYVRSQKLEINIEAATKANMEEIKKIAPGNVNLPKIEAEIKAKYAKLNDKECKVVGRYSEWALDKEVLQKLMKGEDYTNCKEYLKEKNLRMITAVGLVYFDATIEEKSIDAIGAELQAEIEKYGITGNIAFNFKREISQNLNASTNGGYQILVWRHAGYEDLVFREMPH